MDKQTIIELLGFLLAIIFTGVSALFGTFKIKYGRYAHYIQILQELTLASVQSVNNAFVDGLKSKGEFTKEKQKEALNKAITEINAQLTESARKALKEIYGDLDSYIKLLIEKQVATAKAEKVKEVQQ